MGDLTKDFSAAEFKCPCGQCDGGKMDPRFMEDLQRVRDEIGVPLTITSGFRCATHNAAVGGEPDSLHLYGRAADIACRDSALRYHLVDTAIHGNILGIGIAANYVHLDDRGSKEDDKWPMPEMWHYYRKPSTARLRVPKLKQSQLVPVNGPAVCQ